jgi:hypothetical protein
MTIPHRVSTTNENDVSGSTKVHDAVDELSVSNVAICERRCTFRAEVISKLSASKKGENFVKNLFHR